MGEAEQQAVVEPIVANPEAGDIMPGAAGRESCAWRGRVSRHQLFRRGARTGVPADRIPENSNSNLTSAEQNAFSKAATLLTKGLGG